MSKFDGPDPFGGPQESHGQAAADRGQAAADRSQAAADRGQAAADRAGPAAGGVGAVGAAGGPALLLRNSLDALITESQQLRNDVRAAETQRARELTRRRQENMAMFGLLGVLSLLMLLMLTVAWQNNQLSREVQATGDQLSDCTTPGGECFQRSQARTGQAVQRLQLTQLYIVECAREFPDIAGPEFDRKFEACVAARLVRATNQSPLGRPPTAAPTPMVSPDAPEQTQAPSPSPTAGAR